MGKLSEQIRNGKWRTADGEWFDAMSNKVAKLEAVVEAARALCESEDDLEDLIPPIMRALSEVEHM